MSAGRSRWGARAGGDPRVQEACHIHEPVYSLPSVRSLFPSHRPPAPRKDPGADPARRTQTPVCTAVAGPARVLRQTGMWRHKDTSEATRGARNLVSWAAARTQAGPGARAPTRGLGVAVLPAAGGSGLAAPGWGRPWAVHKGSCVCPSRGSSCVCHSQGSRLVPEDVPRQNVERGLGPGPGPSAVSSLHRCVRDGSRAVCPMGRARREDERLHVAIKH